MIWPLDLNVSCYARLPEHVIPVVHLGVCILNALWRLRFPFVARKLLRLLLLSLAFCEDLILLGFFISFLVYSLIKLY